MTSTIDELLTARTQHLSPSLPILSRSPHIDVLKIKPPLVFGGDNAEQLAEAIDDSRASR